MMERAGWRALAARRAEGAERRFVASGAPIAVIDARGAFDHGIAAARALAEVVEANAAAMLVLLSGVDIPRLDLVFAAGATHYLADPFGENEFGQMLRFVDRHVERLAGGYRAASGRATLVQSEAAVWRWSPGAPTIALTQALARRVGADDGIVPLATVMRKLDREGRRAARDAVLRLVADGRPTGFAHGAVGARIAHHLSLDIAGHVVGQVENIEPHRANGPRRSLDVLTGLDDGQALRRWIDSQHESSWSTRCCLIVLAVDKFDVLNATHGKLTGDAVLQLVARRIERQLAVAAGRDRRVARVAGAEFAIALLGPIDAEETALLASGLVEAVGRPFIGDHRMIALSCRVGIALPEGDVADAEALFRRANAALAIARDADVGAIRILDADGEAAKDHDSRLEADLRGALERDEIDIMFQPQVSVTSGRIVGVEALARWRHPALGQLGAQTLFAAAERSDYMAQLSEHVQRKALECAASWPAALSGLRLAINVTASDIARTDFADHFLAMIDNSGFARRAVTVEITESGLIEDLAIAAGLLTRLRAAGLRVAIDDFGTGYSSLAYLKALPLDYLKIDQHLAQDITGSARDRVVVHGVIEMARSLGLSVIAEGVETEEQLALLAAEGCNLYQGFLCSPPIDRESLVALVSQWRR